MKKNMKLAGDRKRGLKAMEMDRISDLPRPILHHILSHLSQRDAVKTCVLSKSWRYLWYGRPNIEFCAEDDFKGGFSVNMFLSVLHQTLIRYETQNLSIQKFILKMPKWTDPNFAPFLEKWIPKIVMRNIKCLETFHLCYHLSSDESMSLVFSGLPSAIYECESLREIHLEGCKLNQIINFNSSEKVLFRHLRTLHLRCVHVEEETFERIMSSCPLIEEVSLDSCEGLKTIKVNTNHNNCTLKTFECGKKNYYWLPRTDDHRIEIAANVVFHIETIKIRRGCRDWFEQYYNNSFTRLKSLYLSYVRLTTKSVHSFSCNFPCLEELELSNCFGDSEEDFFELSSRSVKRFAIEADDDFDPIKVIIDAPNMSEFEYKGYEFPSHISFKTTSNKWKSKIGMTTSLDHTSDIDVAQWLQKLDDLLKVFSQSETSLHIVVDCGFDEYRCTGPPDDSIQVVVKHLELCLGSLCSDYSVWLDVESMWKALIQTSDKNSVQKTNK